MSISLQNILYNKTYVKQLDLEESLPLITRLLRGELRSPEVKKLSGIDYHKQAVYRLKIDEKARLIFTYLKNQNGALKTLAKPVMENYTLSQIAALPLKDSQSSPSDPSPSFNPFLLSLPNDKESEPQTQPSEEVSKENFIAHQLFILEIDPDHKYERLKRRLNSSTCPKIEELAIDIEELNVGDEFPKLMENASTIQWKPAAVHHQKTVIFDEEQQEFFHCNGATLLSGPPGSGKTVVVYQKMLDDLRKDNLSDEPLPIFFISSSELLIHNVRELYQTDGMYLERKVEFFTWEQLLATHYSEYRIQTEADFHQWLSQNLIDDVPKQIHFDFSLIAAFGSEKYASFGDRQCYYSRDPKKQKEIIKLYEKWLKYLEEKKLFDPIVTRLKHNINCATFYVDETQNLPPIALDSLISCAAEKKFDFCLDSEQSLISFPFIKICLKNLAHKYGFTFNEYQLSNTWRSPPEIVAIANHLLDAKYKLDGKNQRREQRGIQSNLPPGTGMACWIQKTDFSKIIPLGQSAKTLVVVFEKPTPAERERINKALGSNNILTPEEIIGFDFDTVILWNPLSQQKYLHKLTEDFAGPLSLDQWLALNRLYVAITRTESSLYIYDQEQKRFDKLAKFLLGDTLTSYQNTIERSQNLSIENERQLWLKQINEHLLAKNWDAAKQIMEFHLKMNSPEIQKKLQEYGFPSQVIQPDPTPQTSSVASSNVAGKKPTGKNRKKQDKVQTKPPQIATSSVVVNKTQLSQEAKEFLNCLSLRNQESLRCLEMLNKKPELIKEIPFKDISLIFKQVFSINKGVSFLCFLSSVTDGRSLLTRIFDAHPEIAKDITSEDLCRAAQDAGPDSNSSALFWLSANPEGRALLTRIFDVHPEIIESITAEGLCRVRTGQNTFALYWLSATPDGRKLLKRILDANSKIAKGITAEDLCRAQTTGPTANTSAMYWLSANPEGRALLTHIFNEHPEIIQDITGEHLCRRRPGPDINTTVLYWLTIDLVGYALLTRIFNENSKIVKGITAEDLCRKQPTGPNENTSILYWLSSNLEGRVLLTLIFNKHPEIAKGITAEGLCRVRTTDPDTNTSVFYWLAANPDGYKLLTHIFDMNPEIFKKITAEDLCRLRSGTHISILYWLCKNPEGRTLLTCIFDARPEIIEGIKGEDLCLALPTGPNAEIPALYWLIINFDGRTLLTRIFDACPEIIECIKGKDLCLAQSSGPNAGIPALYWLIYNFDGRTLLTRIFNAHPKIVKDFKTEDLCRLLPQAAGQNANTSLLHWFAYHSEGPMLLTCIFNENPEIFEGIKGEDLCRMRPQAPGVGIDADASVLYWLACYPEGRTLLTRIFTAYPKIAKNIKAADLCRERPKPRHVDWNTSLLYLLKDSDFGKWLLACIFNANPEIVEDPRIIEAMTGIQNIAEKSSNDESSAEEFSTEEFSTEEFSTEEFPTEEFSIEGL